MNKQTEKVLIFCTLVVLSTTLVSCKKSETPHRVGHASHLSLTVHASPRSDKLFYSGSVKPVCVNTIISPVDGVVSKLNFRYGQTVQPGQAVLTLSSDKLQNQLHDAVSSYVKSKEAFRNSTLSFQGSSQLYKEKIIARQEYQHEKTQLENNELAYLDAQFKLSQLIKSIPGLDQKLNGVNLQEIKNVRKLFDEDFDELSLSAKQSGIVLFPVQQSGKDGGEQAVSVGAEVKKGQALLSIGDLSSLGVEFDAGEMEINRLKPGQVVQVTSPAVSAMSLQGKITSVAVQAKNTQGYNENAKFPVMVKVDTIPETFQKQLRVGMSVRIEVDLSNKPAISVPISAVHKKGKQAEVQVINAKGQQEARLVQVGATTVDSITVEKGLQEGDRVLVHDLPTEHS